MHIMYVESCSRRDMGLLAAAVVGLLVPESAQAITSNPLGFKKVIPTIDMPRCARL